uniref:Exocyst complex component 1 n=1 Tax=Echinococcus granulosus TaxID=6210 RepID=A0A068WDC3_ECHGR|nr:exocyst complex component 1 [Echinococcus granulosus]
MNSQTLKVVDCHDVSEQPSYDIELKTDTKSWRVSAIRLEEKKRFISMFCRAVAIYQPQIYREILLKNLPEGIEFSVATPEALEVAIGEFWGDSSVAAEVSEASAFGQRPGDGYNTLTNREESDLKKFFDRTTSEDIFDADSLMRNLQKYLFDAEGSNVHFIVESEQKVVALISALDMALEELDSMEAKLDAYHQYIADVEESMSGLQDRDQLAQITGDNRRLLLDTLEHIVASLSVNAGVLKTLEEEADMMDIDRYKEAASCLDALFTAERIPGEEHLQAVSEKSLELVALRDKFAKRLSHQVNAMVVRFCSQLMRIAPGAGGVGVSGSLADLSGGASRHHRLHVPGSGSVLNLSGSRSNLSTSPTGSNNGTSLNHCQELLGVQRSEILQLSSLVGGWLQSNRTDVFRTLKKQYIEKMQAFFHRVYHEIIQQGIQTILSLTKSSKHESVKQDSDNCSVLVVSQSNALNQFKPVFVKLMDQLSSVVDGEKNFIMDFFCLEKCKDELDTFACMQMLFSGLNDGMAELIRLCEGQNAVFSMFILLVLSQMSDKFEERPQEQQTQQRKSLAGSFWEQLIKRCISDTRGVLRRHVNSMNQMFRDSKPSRKARCGLLNTMRVYENFAESSLLVFGAGSTIMEQAHSDLICCLMNELDRVAAESVKTPPEVVLLENYHRLYDILCRLKLPSLNDTRKEAKARYQRALQEYSMNCMGRPLEDLHNFFEQVQSALDSGVRPDAICYQFAFQKHMLQKIIKEYPGKEVKKGLDSLRKRVEKNLSEEANLFPVVWRSIQSEVTKQCMFYEELIKKCYSDSGLALDFTIDDLQKYFSEIASAPKRHAIG